ncbi:MAG: NERD domain-containing protein [Bacteroidales bacterium]|nr:NERD domain-containing protein [Bacteroidales bacterium]
MPPYLNALPLIKILLGAFVLIALVVKYFKPKIKGKYGELKVSWQLNRLYYKKFKVINDVLISNNSRSSQIDHIVVSVYGVFVIETKNYKGWIFGHENSDYWTQTLFYNKYKFRNPVIQNWGHINTLKAVLQEFPSIPYFPIIVFTGNARLKKITSEVPVITSKKLFQYILKNSTEEYLSYEQIDQIYQKLISLNSIDRVSRKSHVRKARTRQQIGAKSMTCPRCGGKLILKDGSHGKFYGCANYPRCKYTKDFK